MRHVLRNKPESRGGRRPRYDGESDMGWVPAPQNKRSLNMRHLIRN
jgi:hypothetical protein